MVPSSHVVNSILIDGVPKLYTNACRNDLWVREVVFPNLRNGYFVEAGAADGVSDSSCFLLERQLGWTGLCIEPRDDFFAALSTTRPNSIAVNACLANDTGTVDFVMSNAEDHSHAFFSGVRSVLERGKLGGAAVIAAGETVQKAAVRLVDLLDTHHAPAVIEYGAFDIEGSEYEALREFPFDRYRFLGMTFEVDSAIVEPLAHLLSRNGYLRSTNPFNTDHPWEQYWLHRSIAGGRRTA